MKTTIQTTSVHHNAANCLVVRSKWTKAAIKPLQESTVHNYSSRGH